MGSADRLHQAMHRLPGFPDHDRAPGNSQVNAAARARAARLHTEVNAAGATAAARLNANAGAQ